MTYDRKVWNETAEMGDNVLWQHITCMAVSFLRAKISGYSGK